MRQTLRHQGWIVLCTIAMLGSCGPTATGGPSERDDSFTFTPLTDHMARSGISRMPIDMLQRTVQIPLRGAKALLALIETTPPADFDAVLEADDYDSRIFYGCRAGDCYWHEEPQ